eukprot:g1659.t1
MDSKGLCAVLLLFVAGLSDALMFASPTAMDSKGLCAVLLLFVAGLSDALMFASKAVSKQWDTWGFYENSTFYAYYLITEVSYGEGFGVATSPDGQHWTDLGYVWKGPSWQQNRWWEGSSAVWRAADYNETGRYLINFSEMNPANYQNITFAESFDLVSWTNAGMTNGTTSSFPWFNIDAGAGYKAPRWDTIYSIPVPAGDAALLPGEQGARRGDRDGYPRYGFWTATPENGTMGFGITRNGYDWQALPSPAMLPEPIGAEVGAVDWVGSCAAEGKGSDGGGGAYVAMLGYGWPRTMLAYTAPTPAGPYSRAALNVNFLNGSCYYSRFFHGPGGQLLVTHQTWSNRGTHFSYVSPYKIPCLDADGAFRLKWWAANERLKGAVMALTPPPAGAADPFAWGVGAAADPRAGLLLEADFVLPDASAGANAAQWPGFLLETTKPGAVFVGVGPGGIAGVGTATIRLPSSYVNYTEGPARAVPTHDGGADWEFDGGASAAPSRDAAAGPTDIRSGGPGQRSLALVSHPLYSAGHLIESVSVAFRYVAGYGCTPDACDGPPSLALVVVDAFNHTVVQTLWASGALDKSSYDAFTGYSAPVRGGASGLRVGWPRQTQLGLLFNNSKHNLQLPAASLNITLGWSDELQPGPFEPQTQPLQVAVQERWGRDLPWRPGQRVRARLLARRSMLEMYLDEYLFPVFAAPDQTGRFGVSNASIVTNVAAWNMSLPSG